MTIQRELRFDTPEEVTGGIRRLLRDVELGSRGPQKACFRAALGPGSDDQLQYLTGLITFCEQPGTDQKVVYPNLTLLELWWSHEDMLAFLEQVQAGKAVVDGVALPQAAVSTAQKRSVRLEERYGVSGWPEWVLPLSFNRQGNQTPTSEPVVMPGLRPYGSGSQAVMDWVWRRQSSESSLADRNPLVVVVPDYRSRIKTAEWKKAHVAVEVEGPETAVELQVLVHSGGTHRPEPGLAAVPRGEPVAIPVPADVDRVELFLVRPDGGLASHVVLFSSGEEFEAQPGGPTLQEQAAADLRNGEGLRVEFKPFVLPKNEKESELVETIVAFSNTEGGRLYVGVRRDGSPEGESQLKKVGEGDVEAGARKLMARLRELATEKVKPDVQVDVDLIRIAGEIVIVALVAPGLDGPYATHDNDVYMRKGATNRKPDPRTELPGLGRPPPIAGLAGDRAFQ